VKKNEQALDAMRTNCAVGGGTSYFWARPDARLSVDVLFIDEAAQMALANVLAVSQAAESVVLLGDPRQLEQPIQEVTLMGSAFPLWITSSDIMPPFRPTGVSSSTRHGGSIRSSAPSIRNCSTKFA
jgi:hypothetical protein